MIRAVPVPEPDVPCPFLDVSAASKTDEYLKDASHFKGTAERVYLPSSEKQVAEVLRSASRRKKPVTVAGGRTGLTGASVPEGGYSMSLEKMGRILAIRPSEDGKEATAIVQPGVSLRQLSDALEQQGFFLPPNPGEKASFIGGMVATNASGPRSFKYGPIRPYVRRLRVALASGDIIDLDRDELKVSAGRFGMVLGNGELTWIEAPNYPMPRTKNAAGYYSVPDLDLIDLFIGSEGTLGVFTEIELKAIRLPQAVHTGMVFFNSEMECARFALRARESGRQSKARGGVMPRALEFFDVNSLKLVAGKHSDIPQKAGGAVYFEQETDSATEDAGRLWRELAGQALEVWIADTPTKQRKLLDMRYDVPVMVNNLAAENGFRKIGTDMAVPEKSGMEMMESYLKELGKSKVPYCLHGHMGDDHLHANFLPKTHAQVETALEVYGSLAKKAISTGGTISAEHGIGKARVRYLEMMVGRDGMKQMARVKKALDPHGLLNLGNIFPRDLLSEV